MDRPERFKMVVDVRIEKEEWNGSVDPTGHPKDDPNVGGYWQHTQERLGVNETLDLGGMDFFGVMGVLGSLHESVKRIKEQASETDAD